MGAYVMSHICVGVGSGFISGVMSRSLVFVHFKHIRHAFDRGMWHGCIRNVTHMYGCGSGLISSSTCQMSRSLVYVHYETCKKFERHVHQSPRHSGLGFTSIGWLRLVGSFKF